MAHDDPRPTDPQALCAAAAAGALGITVRCTPWRRTVMAASPTATWFVKLRGRRPRDARHEWDRLHELQREGFRVSAPLCLQIDGVRSALCTAAAPGRAADALWIEAAGSGRLPAMVRYAIEVVAPMIARLHARGLCLRDLYWNHLFVDGEPPAAGEPTCIDVERLLRPRWRRRRWFVKDLAGLWSSLPVSVPRTAPLRFVRSYLGGAPLDRALLAAIAAKAARIRAHRPKFG